LIQHPPGATPAHLGFGNFFTQLQTSTPLIYGSPTNQRQVINLCDGPIFKESTKESRKKEAEDIKCPICFISLSKFVEREVNQHIDECLTLSMLKSEKEEPLEEAENMPNLVSADKTLYVVKQLDSDVNEECTICYDTFFCGQRAARLECWCLFHEGCIAQWFKKTPFCPLHNSNNTTAK